MSTSVWRMFVVVGVVLAAITNFVLPNGHGALDLLYLSVLFAAALAVFAGVIRMRPPRAVAAGWAVLGLGMLGYAFGDLLWVVYARSGRDPFPSPADAVFIAGTLAMIAGSFLLVRSRRQAVDRSTQLDALIVAGGMGSLLWVFIVEPYAVDPSVPLLEQVVAGAYPMLDVLLVATVARLALAGGRFPCSFAILLTGVAMLSVTDVVYYRQELAGSYREWGAVDFAYMVAFVIVAAGSLHPSAARIADMPEEPVQLGPARFVLLSVSATLPLSLLVLSGVLGLEFNVPMLAAAAAVLVALSIARAWSLVAVTAQISELRGHRRFSTMIRNSADAILVIADDDRISYASPALEHTWGIRPSTLLGRPLDRIVSAPDRGRVADWINAVRGGRPDQLGSGALECRWIGGDGASRAVSILASDLRDDPEIAGVVLTARDVSQRVQLERRLRHQAEHDALTGLANRRQLTQELHRALGRANEAAKPALMMIDVDDFKTINDALGHSAGDAVLGELSHRLNVAARSKDVVARLGGDEFAVLLPSIADLQIAVDVAGRIQCELARPVAIDGLRHTTVTLSIGICWAGNGATAEDMLRDADLAMYAAKHGGKRRFEVFDPAMLQAASRRLDLHSRLEGAVERDEFSVVYQPIVRVSDGELVGLEALARWAVEGHGSVSPAEFIPAAESTGAILDIGRLVLTEACRAAAGWTDVPAATAVVSVNVSPIQLAADFEREVAQALATSGLPADRLQLELTESILAEERAAEAFIRLRALGVRLAIDDFGTGYCSLGYLQRFNVDVIKIDRQFAHGAAEDPRLLRGVHGLISALGALPLVEGIERPEDRDTARRIGIPLAQGYLWSRPVTLTPAGAPQLAAVPAPARSDDDVISSHS